jgi:hypothetical protein
MDEETGKISKNKEQLENMPEDEDGSDRRDFLKTAAKTAGAVALASAIGALIDGNADAQDEEEPLQMKPRPDIIRSARTYRNLRLNVAKDTSRKQFGLSGPELGQVLKNEGFIPSNVANLGNAALHVSVSW